MEVKGVNGQVSFDGHFVTIARKGFLARATLGKGDKRIPIGQLTAVQFKPAGALVNGFVQFSLGGGNERRSSFGSQSMEASRDENSVMFNRKQQPAFAELRSAVEAAMAAVHAPATATPDRFDQLRKLGELRNAGLVTPEEFEAQKARLLNS
jgi:hypothetical protein